jgi:hypothetical protein
VAVLCHQFNKQKILKLLNCGPDEDQLRAAIIKRDALEMEAAAESTSKKTSEIGILASFTMHSE